MVNFGVLSSSFKTTSLCIVLALSSAIPADCVFGTYNDKVSTYIDISTHLVNVMNKITIANNLTKPMNSYIFTINPMWLDHFSYIEALNSDGLALEVNQMNQVDTPLQFNITLDNHVSRGESYKMSVLSVYTHCLSSLPRNVKQGEQHLVLFSFNVLFYSQSLTTMQETFVSIGANKLLSVDGGNYSVVFKENGQLLKYGPYFDIKNSSVHLSTIHYNNKSPFLTVQELDRYILLSHWGYVSVWDIILLVHSGPKFVGPFERGTGFQRSDLEEDTRVESYTTTLPKDAFNIYIKDEIGIVWTYDVTRVTDGTLVKIRPRFVMYGGWKTRYEIGYTVAISDYLKEYPGDGYFSQEFFFEFPSIDSILPNMVVDRARINVILPEGATFLQGSENATDTGVQKYCYYLDSSCRTRIAIEKYNLVDKHRSNIQISYGHPQVLLLAKPMLISMYLFIMLIVFIVLSRFQCAFPSYTQPNHLKPANKRKIYAPNQNQVLGKKKKKGRNANMYGTFSSSATPNNYI